MCALSQRDFRDDSLDLHVHCTLFIDSGLYGQGTEFLGISEENSPVQVCGCLVQIQPVPWVHTWYSSSLICRTEEEEERDQKKYRKKAREQKRKYRILTSLEE